MDIPTKQNKVLKIITWLNVFLTLPALLFPFTMIIGFAFRISIVIAPLLFLSLYYYFSYIGIFVKLILFAVILTYGKKKAQNYYKRVLKYNIIITIIGYIIYTPLYYIGTIW